jgi:peptidoglycan/xylan/chitin deacetylase (PgdA/CDA1 family)
MNETDRAGRRRAARARRRRRRLIALGIVLAALAATGAGIALLVGGGSSAAPRTTAPPPPPPPPPPRYVGSKLPPPPRPRRRGFLPTPAEQRKAVARLVKLGLPILCAGPRGRYIALTFDDGPGEYTELAMKILRKRHMRATFFLVGRQVTYRPDLPAKESALGALGDHTWTHPYLPGLSSAAILDQITSTRAEIRRTAKTDVLLFRPPYGGRDARVDAIVNRLGLLQVLWSVDSGDSTGSDVLGVYRNVLAGLKPGAIILMHENRATTIKSLIHYVLPAIQRRHLIPVSVPELLALDPPSYEQVRSRRC